MKFDFNNIVEVHEGMRITDRKPGLHYYELRHAGYDWSIPITVETANVCANYCGTIVCRKPIRFPENGSEDSKFPYMFITKEEGVRISQKRSKKTL